MGLNTSHLKWPFFTKQCNFSVLKKLGFIWIWKRIIIEFLSSLHNRCKELELQKLQSFRRS